MTDAFAVSVEGPARGENAPPGDLLEALNPLFAAPVAVRSGKLAA
jgi:hypothetical protein